MGDVGLFVQTMVDKESTSFYSPYFDRDVDTSHLVLVITANFALKGKAFD